MLSSRIYVTFTAIATVAIALPAIALPPTPPSNVTQSAAVKPIEITDLVGIYAQFGIPHDRLTIKSDGSYEVSRRRDFNDPKTQYVEIGKVRLEGNVVFLDTEITDGPTRKVEDKSDRVRLNLRMLMRSGFYFRKYPSEQGGGKSLIYQGDNPGLRYISIEPE
jgi:hypothetical protein